MTWRDRAACKGALDLFFPDGCNLDAMRSYPARVGAGLRAEVAAAKSVCRGCPVRAECLDLALTERHWFGVFGGMDPVERRIYAHACGIHFDDDDTAMVG